MSILIPVRNAGYPMARNLRAKIPESDTLIIHDVNEAVMQKFASEATTEGGSLGAVEITDSARTVAEKAVSEIYPPFPEFAASG
jgi:hypothetical protein